MRSRSVASSLVLVLLLSTTAPVYAAPRDRDQPRWDRPFNRIVRVIKKFFGVTSTGDMMIPPIP